jgi:hypothetical protein
VPDGQYPGLITPASFGYPSVVGTDRGFLLLQLNEVWTSENGYNWRRLAGETTDPDLDMGPDVATTGGPRSPLVATRRSPWTDRTGVTVPRCQRIRVPDRNGRRDDRLPRRERPGCGDSRGALADNSDEHLVMPLVGLTVAIRGPTLPIRSQA